MRRLHLKLIWIFFSVLSLNPTTLSHDISNCFLTFEGFRESYTSIIPNSSITRLCARSRLRKAAADHYRSRPKKSKISDIFTKPTKYNPNPQIFEGAPPEYLSLPPNDVLKILKSGEIYQILCALRGYIDKEKLRQIVQRNNYTGSELNLQINHLQNIYDEKKGKLTWCVIRQIKEAINYANGETEKLKYLAPDLYELKRIKLKWSLVQERKFDTLLKRKFLELVKLAKKLEQVGIPLTEFSDSELWEKYNLLSDLPKTSFIDNYFYRHSYTINSTEEALNTLKSLGVLRSDGVSVDLDRLNFLSKTDKENLRQIVAVKDFLYKKKFESYNVIRSVTELEKYVEADLRRHTLILRLKEMYDDWLKEGSKFEDQYIYAKSKFQALSLWKALPKRLRKDILYNELRSGDINEDLLKKLQNYSKAMETHKIN